MKCRFIWSSDRLESELRDGCIWEKLVTIADFKRHPRQTFKCTHSRCKTCPFIHNGEKISGPKRSIKITDYFTCNSANVIYWITCTNCDRSYIGETGKRLVDRFREHLCDVEINDKDTSKPSPETLISFIILNSIWQFAAFPYIYAIRKVAKL